MALIIFFSWQAQTPNGVGRSFLREALDQVCKDIASDTSVDEALRDLEVDSDTQGIAGQPAIVETILDKIDASAVFVADMTFVGKQINGKPTPNPNVLIEYGWALKALKSERIVCVMNTAYGTPDNLPFDLHHRRWPIRYYLPENVSHELRKQEKEKLINTLTEALRLSLGAVSYTNVEALPEFRGTNAKEPPARFRNQGEPLGIEDDRFAFGTDKEIFLSSGPAIWLRLMPRVDAGRRWSIHELRERVIGSGLMPLLHPAGGYSYLRAADGIGVYYVGSRVANDPKATSFEIRSVAFAFDTGEVWSIDTDMLSHRVGILPFVESYLVEGIANYAGFLRSLGSQSPYRWDAGITGINGRRLNLPGQPSFAGARCVADSIELSGECENAGEAKKALQPFFEKIFDKCGLRRSDFISE